MVFCKGCRPQKEMAILTLEQTPDYTVGWQCDDCAFRSTVNSELPRSRQRFHCVGCSEDVCILCGRKRAKEQGSAQPEIPELPEVSLSRSRASVDVSMMSRASLPDASAELDGFGNEGALGASLDGEPPAHTEPFESGADGSIDHTYGRRESSDDAGLSGFSPRHRINRDLDTSWSERVRRDEESSHAAWFSAAKKQWLEGVVVLESNKADSAVEPKGGRTVIEAQGDDDGAASVPTTVTVEVPSFSKAPAGHIVYNVKVYDRGARDGWTVLKRYSDFRALWKSIKRGFKHSKFPDDLRSTLPFPRKDLFPDLDRRRADLEVWLQDVVSKVSMHVCDDDAARQASLFLGLKASAYLDIPEERRSASPSAMSQEVPVKVFRVPSQGGEVAVTTEKGRGSANMDRIVAEAEAARLEVEDAPTAAGRRPSASDAKLSSVSSVRLFEAIALYEEGLIGETDLIFARKGIVDEIVQSDKPPVTKLREAAALLKQSLITQKEYEDVKRGVLTAPTDIFAAGGASGRSSPQSSEYGSVHSVS
mmetsp:Transcript_35170/g.92030  ORF Transcript_35170/g.92030 Transcript_35170/m.92030 type:complete len:535 (-) Transcript_35170:156-1760(-)